jgi:hypothetical protein
VRASGRAGEEWMRGLREFAGVRPTFEVQSSRNSIDWANCEPARLRESRR